MNGVILIGGSPTVGKSYTARKLAEDLKLPWISTDTIREQMREIVRKKEYPSLFLFDNYTPKMSKDYLTNSSAKKIVYDQNKESIDVWKGITAIIEKDYVWKSFIIEGVAILPSFASKLKKKNKNAKVIFLIDEDRERLRKTVFTRGVWSDDEKFPDHVKEKEFEFILEFNKYIKREAKKYKLPIVKMGNRKDYINEIKRIIAK